MRIQRGNGERGARNGGSISGIYTRGAGGPDETLPLARAGAHQPRHFAGSRVPASGPLGEEQLAIEGDLEDAARTRDQGDLERGEFLPELGRQTGGPGLIVSDDAVLDRQLHGRPGPREGRTLN
jgi:hypothetical protein